MITTTIGTEINGSVAWLDAPAAASWRRMVADGMPTGGITDSGRAYTAQVTLFLDRYTTNYERSAKHDRRVWQGRVYWRLPGVPAAAVPGTSNHESGNALDLTGATLAWVRAHGSAYGWICDRVTGEPWHVEYKAARDTRSSAPAQEDDMFSDADREAVTETRRMLGVLLGWQTPQGPEIAALERLATGTAAQVAAAVLGAKVDAQTGTLAQTTRDARQISAQVRDAVAALGQVSGGGVAIDYAALARAVNDDAARRLAT